jgi:hypothetical protein
VITVVLVEPGAIRTGLAARALAGLAPYRDPTSPYAPALASTDAAWARVYRLAPGPEPRPPEGERSPAPVGVPGAVHTPGCAPPLPARLRRPGPWVQVRKWRALQVA